jgi:hypothetical protein
LTDHSSTADDAAGEAGARVEDAARQVSEQVRQARVSVRSRLRGEVDARSTAAGEQVGLVSQAMRDMSGRLRSQGNDLPARLADEVADRAERLGGYLRESDGQRILGDVEDFGRRQPWVIAAVGIVLGTAAARFLKASSQRRYQRRSGDRTRPVAPRMSG